MALNSNFRTLTANNIEGIVDERNYLSSSFENGTLTGWTEMSVALTSGLPTGTPTISSTAASSLALSTTTSTPLSGSRSMLMTVASALTAGHGFISQEFTLDRMDLGKVLTVSFDYERISGTYNFSGTLGSQTLMVYIYDATAGGANWIQPAGFLGMNQSSGPGRVVCTFQSSVVAGQKYRVAVIASQAASGASSIEFDNFTCSRQTAPIGPVVTDWVSYTPTGSWVANTTYTGQWRRVGSDIEIDVNLALSGAPTATPLTISIPSGLSIDTTKISGNIWSIYGHGQGINAGTGYYFQVGNITSSSFGVLYQSTTAASQSVVTATAPVTWVNGNSVHMRCKLPIVGWSSNVQLSNDTDTRVVAFVGSINAQAYTSLVTNLAVTVSKDSHGTFSSGIYTIPVSGDYSVNATIISDQANFFPTVYLNGSIYTYGTRQASASQATTAAMLIPNLKAGDTISLRIGNTNGNTIAGGYFSVNRLSGPSVVAASESVSAIYQTSAGQSVPNNSATVIVFGTKIFDSHSAMNASTGVFTCPVSGEYQLSAAFYFSTAITATATDIQTIAYKNGVAYLGVNNTKPGTSAAPLTTSGTIRIRCNAGDTLSCAVLQSNSALTAQSLLPNATFNWVAISRVGN